MVPHYFSHEDILRAAENGELIITTSALTLVEVIRARGTIPPLSSEAEQAIKDLFEHEFILLVDLTRFLAEEARKYCWQFGIPPRDAIHLASAINSSVEYIESYDEHFLKLNGKIEGIAVEIREPSWQGQISLFE